MIQAIKPSFSFPNLVPYGNGIPSEFLKNSAQNSPEFRRFCFVFFAEFCGKIRNKYGTRNTEYGIPRNSAEFNFFRVKTEYGNNGIRNSAKFRGI